MNTEIPKEVRRMSRLELMEILVEQGREIERLKGECARLEHELKNARSQMRSVGTVDEAVDRLYEVISSNPAAAAAAVTAAAPPAGHTAQAAARPQPQPRPQPRPVRREERRPAPAPVSEETSPFDEVIYYTGETEELGYSDLSNAFKGNYADDGFATEPMYDTAAIDQSDEWSDDEGDYGELY